MKLSRELERANQILNSDDKEFQKYEKEENVINDLRTFLVSTIRTNLCSTIGIKYEAGRVYVSLVYPSGNKLKIFENYNADGYNDICHELFKIDLNEKYNCSRTIVLDGVRTRVYAMMPPFVQTPNITISTTKQPPTKLNKQTISDADWDKIVHSNWIVVGASGSGKTYLTNYLINKYIRPDERIAIIEEFGELIPPNDLTNNIIIPPAKPGELRLLEFVTEQSNLMRLDAIFVGEIKGKEAWPMVNNMASGTRGSFTMHGDSARQALNRLKALCRLSCDNDEAIDDFIAKSINYIIVMEKRNIKGIYELKGTHLKGNFAMEEFKS